MSGWTFVVGVEMVRPQSSIAYLCFRQNPKSSQGTTPQIRNRNFSSDQINGSSVELKQNPQNPNEIFAQNRIFCLVETNGASIELGQNPQNPVEILAQDQNFSVSKIAKEVCRVIRSQPRWETTLLSDFPTVNFVEPAIYNEILKQQSNAFLSFRFYLWLRSLSVSSLDPILCNEIFVRLVEAGAAKAATSFLEDPKFEPEPFNLELYIRCLCESGLFNQALDVFERLKMIGHSTSLQTWNWALSHAVRTKRVDVVRRLYGDVLESGVVTDINTHGYYIQANCLENNVFIGYKLLQEVLNVGHVPHITVFNKLISSLSKNGKYGKVSAVLHNMIAKDCSPDISTYLEVLSGLCQGIMRSDGSRICEERLRHEGFRMFRDLKERGYFPDRAMYTTLIGSFSRNKDIGVARKLWFEMIEEGIVPNEYSYCALIQGLWKTGRIKEAKKLHKEMLDKGHKETIVSYNTMIYGLCLNGKVEKAQRLFEKMNEKGIDGDAFTYSYLIEGFSRRGNVMVALYFCSELLKKRLKPSTPSFSMLIDKLCESEHVEEAEILWQEMRDRGLEPAITTLNQIIFGLSNEGRVANGMKWFHHMISNGARPKNTTSQRLFIRLSEAKRLNAALSVLGYMTKMGFILKKSICDTLVSKHHIKNGLGNSGIEAFFLRTSMINDYDEIDRKMSIS